MKKSFANNKKINYSGKQPLKLAWQQMKMPV